MLLAAVGTLSCTELTTFPDVGCTGSTNYTVHVGVFLKV
jgi:hypothetical protein